MKVNKILAIIQLSLMIISLVFLYVAGFIAPDAPSELIRAFAVTGLISILVADTLAVVITIIAFVSIFKNNTTDTTKFVMIYKIIAIPWFIANFVFCLILVAALLNPFTMIAIPLVIAILSLSTYVCMIPTSMMNVGYVISYLRRKVIKVSPLIIIGLIFGFIFCLDLLGAIFVFAQNKKQLNSSIEKTAH